MSGEDVVERERERVIESMERSAEVYGLSRSAGRVYGVLYFARDPLSIPDLVEKTGYAKSTISNVTRRLTRIGLIHRRSSGGGGRRVQFEAETDAWFILQDVFQQYVRREMQATLRTLRRAEDRIDADSDDTAQVAHDHERIRELRRNYENLEDVLRLATEFSPTELVEALEEYDR